MFESLGLAGMFFVVVVVLPIGVYLFVQLAQWMGWGK